MASVVLELQQDALDRRVPVTDLLRKALVVAHKLSMREFEQWVTQEINGYGKDDQVPEYRQIHGQVKAWNPYRGWQPVTFKDPEIGERLSVRPCGQSIAELESLFEGEKRPSTLHMPFSIAMERHMSKATSFDTQFTLEIPATQRTFAELAPEFPIWCGWPVLK